MMGIWVGVEKNFVPRIWSADSNDKGVFRRQVGNDMSFALAAPLPSDDHVNQPFIISRIQAQMACGTSEYILWSASACVYDDVRGFLKSRDAGLGLVPSHC